MLLVTNEWLLCLWCWFSFGLIGNNASAACFSYVVLLVEQFTDLRILNTSVYSGPIFSEG
jgi:hypothetical protein